VILGPDHIAAIATVSACQGSAALWYGVRWGIGHSTGLIIIALMLWMVDSDPNVPSDAFSRYASYVSGVFMILFGLYFVREVFTTDKIEFLGFNEVPTESTDIPMDVVGDRDECRSLSPKESLPGIEIESDEPNAVEPISFRQASASLFAGIIGGVAGPGGILAIVPASYYSTKLESVTYIMTFIVSSTVCMGLVAWLYGSLTERLVVGAANKKRQEVILKLVSSGASIVVGVMWILLTAFDIIHLD
jgi:uncharacterized membrane protein YfcA